MRELQKICSLGKIPLHIGFYSENHNPHGIPDLLEFEVGLNRKLDLIIQMPNRNTTEIIKKIYMEGPQIGNPMKEDGFGFEYANEFISFISNAIGKDNFGGLDILEIGCGTGFLMKQLHNLNANVVGIDPGSKSAVYAKEAGLEVIPEEFSSNAVNGKFDLIVHANVLEHVHDPIKFLSEQLSVLKKGGRIVICIPDCTIPIERGDISMFIHQHTNYFTEDSLKNLATVVGTEVVSCRKADFGAVMYASLMMGNHIKREKFEHITSADKFSSRVINSIETIKKYIEEIIDRGESIGIFCPGRFINYHLAIEINYDKIRFFDDDPIFEGKYFPPIDVPIESRKSLIANPVENILIVSRAFGTKITASLREIPQLKKCRIVTIEELF